MNRKILMMVLAAWVAGFGFPAPSEGGYVAPAKTTNDLSNPDKGFMLWGTDYAFGAPDNYFSSTVFHVYVPWREVETADQAFAWAQFESNHLQPITSDYPQATFVLRLVADYPDGPASGISHFYTGGENDRDYPKFLEQPPLNIGYHDYASCDSDGPGRTPDWNNPVMITQMVQLVQAFAQRYDGDPRLTAIQVGVLGLWGEWHQSGCDAYQPSNAAKIAVRDAFALYFTNMWLQTRYPRDPDAVGVEFGFHEDYFPSFTAPCVYDFPDCDDSGDWNMDWCFRNVTPASTNNWLMNPISGESPNSQQQKAWTNDTADILKVIRDYHFSFLGPAGAHEYNKSQSILQQIKRQLGYNYHIESFSWPDQIYLNEPFQVTLVLTNSGAAPCYRRYPVELSICQTNGAAAWTNRWQFDLRQVIPGKTWSFTEDFTVSGISTGAYSVRLAILNPCRNYAPGVLIQSAGRDSQDRYVMGDVAVQPSDADGDGMPDFWEMSRFGVLTNKPDDDADHDGTSNLSEYLAGTDPTNEASLFQITEFNPAVFMGPVVKWASVSGHYYSIERSANLMVTEFLPLTSGVPAIEPLNSWTDALPPASDASYYRVSTQKN